MNIMTKNNSSVNSSTPLLESAMSSAVERAMKRLLDDHGWHGAYLALRSMAVAHPALVLRHLNTLAALVEGRVQPSTPQKEFIERPHHLRLHLNVLAILDSLRPHVFHSPWLDRVLEAYFGAIGAVCGSYNKALSGLLAKFVEFLQAALRECTTTNSSQPDEQEDNIRATNTSPSPPVSPLDQIMSPARRKLLVEISQVFLEVRGLEPLLSALALHDHGIPASLQQHQHQQLSDTEVAATRALLRIPEYDGAEERGGARERLLDTLADLDLASLRSPSVLQVFRDDLLHLLDCPSTSSSWSSSLSQLSLPSSAASFHFAVLPLLLRLLHYSPRDAESVIPRYVECLASPKDEVLREALKYAPDYFPFARDCQAQEMLSRLFGLVLARPLLGAIHPLKSILVSSFQRM